MIEMGLLPIRSFGTVTVDTNPITVYTCPSTMFAQAVCLLASDDAADARTLTVTWTDSSGAVTYTLAYQRAIAANTTMDLQLYRLALDPGDTLKVTGSAAGIHVTVNVIEYARSVNARSA